MSISNPDSRYQPHLREFAGLSLAGGAATGVASWGTEHHSTGGLGGLAALDRGVALRKWRAYSDHRHHAATTNDTLEKNDHSRGNCSSDSAADRFARWLVRERASLRPQNRYRLAG